MMRGAFLYLAVCSMRNRLHVRLRRLREPRYFLGLVIGMAYVGFVLTRPVPNAYQSGGGLLGLDDNGMTVALLGAAGLLLATALAWILPGSGRPALTFSRADVQFLFTAPISRRQLLHYKVLRSQAGAVLGSALMTLVLRPQTLAQGWTFFVGMLIVMATVNLHLTGVSLRRESLRTHGAPGFARQWLPLALVVGAVAVVAGAVVLRWPVLNASSSPHEVLAEVRGIGRQWPVRVALWPFLALMRLPLSGGATSFLAALPFAVAAFLANYLWVLRSDVAFEEAAARDAERQVARGRAPARTPAWSKRRPEPFRLAPTGRPEIALLWKNLILASRAARLSVAWRLAPLLVVAGFAVSQAARTAADALATLATLAAAGVTVVGPQVLRNDLRRDLAGIATLKQWPITGAAIVRGEVLAPTVLLSSIVLLLMAVALALSSSVTFDLDLDWPARAGWVMAAMLVAPALILVQVVVQNALAVLFPAWMDLGATTGRGMEVMGQRVLAAGGLIAAVGVALVPAFVVAVVVSIAARAAAGVDHVAIPAAAASATLVIESWLVILGLGRRVDRMDAGAVPAAE